MDREEALFFLYKYGTYILFSRVYLICDMDIYFINIYIYSYCEKMMSFTHILL